MTMFTTGALTADDPVLLPAIIRPLARNAFFGLGGLMETKRLVPAAQYVRMSTEDQQYSIANQEAAIQTYATSHGYVVMSTYADAGKRGVAIKHRKELRRLLHDVTSGQAQYETILVYDVSRFGRFQDVDEAAHYVFLCKSAGVPVRYCAEQFDNDEI